MQDVDRLLAVASGHTESDGIANLQISQLSFAVLVDVTAGIHCVGRRPGRALDRYGRRTDRGDGAAQR